MLSAKLILEADKSQAYFDSLCKHFSRKVEVVREANRATVAFPMATCYMQVDQRQMQFTLQADCDDSLARAKYIIESHALRFGELKGAQAIWSC